MSSKSVLLGSLLIGGLVSIGGPAEANINTSGTACQNYNAAEALDIDYLVSGVRNVNASPRSVICPLPRSPIAAGTRAGFWINGHNDDGTTTACTLFVTSYLGRPVGSMSFTATAGDWDTLVEFAADVVTTYDYVSVLCSLPGNGGGVIRGVTARQP